MSGYSPREPPKRLAFVALLPFERTIASVDSVGSTTAYAVPDRAPSAPRDPRASTTGFAAAATEAVAPPSPVATHVAATTAASFPRCRSTICHLRYGARHAGGGGAASPGGAACPPHARRELSTLSFTHLPPPIRRAPRRGRERPPGARSATFHRRPTAASPPRSTASPRARRRPARGR